MLDDPWQLAGTALPDWIAVAHREATIRRPGDLSVEDAAVSPSVVALREGVLRHLRDDGWFHDAPLFDALSGEATRRLRELADPPERPSFIGHVLVELLVDAGVETLRPGAVDQYYRATAALDPSDLAEAAVVLRPQLSPSRFVDLFQKFREFRFVADYGDDERLAARLDGVGRRAAQPPLDRTGVASVASKIRPRAVELAELVLSTH